MKKESELLFEEVQAKTSKSISGFFKAASLIVLAALVITIVLQKGRASDFTYLLITIFSIVFIINLLLPFNLVTQIRADGIYVRFPPLQPSFKKFSWSDISEVYIRNYDALSEYFGGAFALVIRGSVILFGETPAFKLFLRTGIKF